MMEHGGIPQNHYFSFPWLNGSSEVLLKTLQLPPDTLEDFSLSKMVAFLFSSFPDLKDRILAFFQNAAENVEQITTPTDDVANLAMYPILQVIVSMLGNRVFGNALSNIFAKHCQDELDIRISSNYGTAEYKTNDRTLQLICENVGIHTTVITGKIIEGVKYPFQMSFASYLAAATKINDERWKLINRIFMDGMVYLIRHDVGMLLREFVRMKTKPDFSPLEDKLKEELENIPAIAETIAAIEDLIKLHTSRFQASFLSEGETVGYDLFPPCIRSILIRASQGENLNHNERLAIAFFYLNTNHSIEETVDIFRTIPDFDEGIARYQVEFAAGSGGKGKKYSMFKCAKLKSLHLCYAADSKIGDPLCVKGGKKKNGDYVPIRNPATDYIFWKKVEQNRLHRSQVAVVETAIDEIAESNEPLNEPKKTIDLQKGKPDQARGDRP